MIFSILARLFPQRKQFTATPQRIVLILPCCIGDVVMATAALAALRRAYPEAQITWAVGTWSRQVVMNHPLLDALLDTGAGALPLNSPRAIWRFVRQLRRGKYDLALSLVRSPRMSFAVWLAGIPQRAGLDSGGRGFGYNLRHTIDPQQRRHEGALYLDVVARLGISVQDTYANIPLDDADRISVRRKLSMRGVRQPYLVINPAGGRNPGMVLDAKRYPPANFAALADRLAGQFGAQIVLVAGPKDTQIIAEVLRGMSHTALTFAGGLGFGEIAALAHDALLYIGNDTGLTHLAAAAGARTVMILGPSDPVRYAPFVPDALVLWREAQISRGGVAGGTPKDWDWAQHGIRVQDAEAQIVAWFNQARK